MAWKCWYFRVCEGGSPKRTRNPLPNPTSSQKKGCLEELLDLQRPPRGLQGSRGPPGASRKTSKILSGPLKTKPVPAVGASSGSVGGVPGASGAGISGSVRAGAQKRRETHYQTQHPRKKGCSEELSGTPQYPFGASRGAGRHGASRPVRTPVQRHPGTCPGRPEVGWDLASASLECDRLLLSTLWQERYHSDELTSSGGP